MKTFSLHTTGCRLNQYETEAIGSKLESIGFQEVPYGSQSELTVINACTVTARADADARRAIRRARRSSPQGKVVVTGCFAQAMAEVVDAMPEVDLRVDSDHKDLIIEKIVGAFGYAMPGGIDVDAFSSPDFTISGFRQHTRAMVKIQDGCQETCSYCIIPKARGRERSRTPEAVLREVNALAAAGYKEVVLTGVHVGKYRHQEWRLVDLLQLLISSTHIERIRLSSLEPREFRAALVELIVSEPRICPHLHVPVQSGHDHTLRAMRRSYDTSFVRELFDTLSLGRRNLAIGTDVITGFPGETKEQFEHTEAFLRSLPLAYLHVFSYSDRPGTTACEMPGKLHSRVIKERTNRLRDLSDSLRTGYITRFVGKNLPVLVEQRRDRITGHLIGMTDNFIRVVLDGSDELMNEIIPVRIEKVDAGIATGKAA